MTLDKGFKKLVRSRMAKTGEAYSAARKILLSPQTIGAVEKPGAADAEFGGVADPEPILAECTFCGGRYPYEDLQPVTMADREGGDESLACQKCSRDISEEAMEEIKSDREHLRVLRAMLELDMKLIYAHGGLFHIQDDGARPSAGDVAGDVVAEMEARKYIAAFRHPHAAHAFELTEDGRSLAVQDIELERRKAEARWPVPPGGRRRT